MRKPCLTLCTNMVAVLLAGCSLAPTHERPALPVAAAWPHTAAPARSEIVVLAWQDFVADRGLRALIGTALANNRNLRQSLLNVEAARAAYGIQRAERLPALQLQAGVARKRLPDDLRTPGQPAVQGSYQAGPGLAAFELDLFGRVRNLSEAALQEYLATEEGARSASISLVGEVIRLYLEREGALRRQALAARTLEARKTSLELVAQRRLFGAADDLEYQVALGLVRQVEIQLERIEREQRQAGNALALLVGVPIAATQASPKPALLLVQDLSPGTPSDLLGYRPDIRAAEHRLRSRNADIGAARAAFFPRLALTGSAGSASAELSGLFEGGARTWSFAPQLSLPILDIGRNRANLDLAKVRKNAAVAAYEETVQGAFREVADALAARDTLEREEKAQREMAEASARALRLAETRYLAGTDDYLRYLDAQRSDLANQIALIEVQTQRQLALAALFQALGGGWRSAPSLPAQSATQAATNHG